MKIYWSGAALALMADIELRQRSDGEQSLDAVLDRLQHCCLPSQRTWSGPELFERLDSLAGIAVFMPLYERYANQPGFPNTRDALSRLGVEMREGSVRLAPDAELARIRSAITGPPSL